MFLNFLSGRLYTMISQDVSAVNSVLVSITIAFGYFGDAKLNGLPTRT